MALSVAYRRGREEKVAERVGFEPTVSFPTPQFECGALDQLCDLSS